MYRHLKKYMIFIVGAFICSLFLVLAFTTDRKNDNSVNCLLYTSANSVQSVSTVLVKQLSCKCVLTNRQKRLVFSG